MQLSCIIFQKRPRGSNAGEQAPLQSPAAAGGDENNIYDEVYELPERAAGAAANVPRAGAGTKQEPIPSYYVEGNGAGL